MTAFSTKAFSNGVVVDFVDGSTRYFGDYHRVYIEVRITAPSPQPDGAPVQRSRRLERMGVAGADVESTRRRMVEDFLESAGRYLGHADYPARLADATTVNKRHLSGSFPAGNASRS